MFFPNLFQRLISIAFFPLTIIYCIIVAYKRLNANPIDFGLPIISIGNLVVGGSGKTPITIELAKDKQNAFIILRGFGRSSKGLYVVSNQGKILVDVEISGDEAMLLAQNLPNASVIVSENRIEAILKAKEMGAKIVFLDDGYSHHNIKKFDILIRPKDEPTNLFCLPSGGYRETKMMYSFVPVVLRDGEDFKRIIKFKKDGLELKELPSNVILLTAISKPQRLLEFLPKNITMKSFADHHSFTREEINELLLKNNDTYFIVTQKDMVKLAAFNLTNLILMDLTIEMIKKIDLPQ
ncbi:MAG: tetraacyldisaccharide 4'-kinase [Arcobacteraceae bacterium]